MVNDILRDMDIDDATRAAHADGCIECQADGCTGCGSAFCELPRLVEHEREWMCPGCIPAFDAHVANRCDGTTCHCSATPELADDLEETTPVAPLTDREIAKLDPLGVFRRLAMVAALVLACVSGVACAHGPTPVADQAETVGQLAAGPSVYTAPLKHDLPPSLGFVAGSDDDDVSSVATTTVRVDANGAQEFPKSFPDAAPEVVGKGGGLTTGEAR